MNTLGDRIRILRSGRALTQQAVAEALGVSRSAVAMWEKDEREPNLETLTQLAKLLNVPLSALEMCIRDRCRACTTRAPRASRSRRFATPCGAFLCPRRRGRR